jgi:hypothetical protein
MGSKNDFADLLWIKSGPSEPKLSTTASSQGRVGQSKSSLAPAQSSRPNDTFTALAHGNKSLYSYPPSPMPSVSRNTTPSLPSVNAPNAEAFGDLLTSSNALSSADLSIAERQEQLAQAAREAERKRAQETKDNSAFWERFESQSPPGAQWQSLSPSLASSVPSYSQSSLLIPTVHNPTSRPTSATTSASKGLAKKSAPLSLDVLGEFDMLSIGSSIKSPAFLHPPLPPTKGTSDDLLDFGAFEQAPRATSATNTEPVSRSETVGDFDFGDHNNSAGLLDGQESDDDDILGELAKPVDAMNLRQTNVSGRTARLHFSSFFMASDSNL